MPDSYRPHGLQPTRLPRPNLVFLFVFNTNPTIAGFHGTVSVSGSVVSDSSPPHGLWPSILRPWGSPGKNTGVGCLSLLQGIFLTQGSTLSLLLGPWILYQGAMWEAQKKECLSVKLAPRERSQAVDATRAISGPWCFLPELTFAPNFLVVCASKFYGFSFPS